MACGCNKSVKRTATTRVSQPVRTRQSKLAQVKRSTNNGSKIVRRVLERY